MTIDESQDLSERSPDERQWWVEHLTRMAERWDWNARHNGYVSYTSVELRRLIAERIAP